MRIPDVNVLVGAFRADAAGHAELRQWLLRTLSDGEPLGLTPPVSAGVVRVLTHARIFNTPDTLADALAHLEALRGNPAVVEVGPGPRHWDSFSRLCREADARGNLVADAAHAAIAIEHDATWVTLDRDFARFPGLRWEVPQVSR
ncbi:type II toxin-antitoxin system VapC family toxin [Agromyces bauzanensis]|uniref:Ribonuclease VapC n=1 Tax=Agromyces bauzanensis TaxID=1308924 RepID=A0A917PNB3_9MICO|nr:type II toxin-antitoxin system VapC family toxin [Agromyces bauzanensis]GGJ85911.1 ribonuclease VapC [Agromyces bauzanensis]